MRDVIIVFVIKVQARNDEIDDVKKKKEIKSLGRGGGCEFWFYEQMQPALINTNKAYFLTTIFSFIY